MDDTRLAFLPIADLVAALDAGELSSREITLLALRRIERLDAAVTGYMTVLADRALAEADAADRMRAAGARGGILGVPVAIKDLCETAGVPTSAGSRILRGWTSDRDATVVRKLQQAGAVILGKTHMAEFAYGFPHPDYGPSLTPWNLGYSASGSSGGSGAVVAAGLAWGAIGTDTGGSIRSPAAVCAITGHKPTYGLVSRHGVVPLSWSLDHVGPMTRTARDAMLLLAAIAGHDGADGASAPVAAWHAPGPLASLRGMTVGVLHELAAGIDAEQAAAFERSLQTLADLGATLEEVDIPDLDLVNAMAFAIMEPEALSFHATWLRERPEDYAQPTRQGLEAAALMPATQYVDAQRLRRRFCAGFAGLFERRHVLVSPSDGTLAYPARVPEAMGHETWDLRHTVIANLAGVPAVAIPNGFAGRSLPTSLQIIAPPFEDGLALQVAELYQSVTDWHARVPPGFE